MALTDSGRGLDTSHPAHAAQVPLIRRAIEGAARGWGADPEMLMRIGLAVTEAATNAVIHAYRPSQPTDRIHVRVHRDNGFLLISIRDDGIGMGPRADSPGLGLGLSLMEHEADRCEIRAGLRGGTEVLLRFGLPGRRAPDRWRTIGCEQPAPML